MEVASCAGSKLLVVRPYFDSTCLHAFRVAVALDENCEVSASQRTLGCDIEEGWCRITLAALAELLEQFAVPGSLDEHPRRSVCSD